MSVTIEMIREGVASVRQRAREQINDIVRREELG